MLSTIWDETSPWIAWKKYWDTPNSVKTLSIKKILKTKRKLQEDDDYESEEAMRYAVKKKYLILKATGTLSDDDLEEEDENP